MVHELVKPRSVVDVGCGEGWWAQAFADLGCDILGIDGEYVQGSPLGERFVARDLNEPLALSDTFDLAVSLEVAEHLPPERAESFVADLCALAPVVLFSAAIPGQTGAGHVNCQWPSYWVELFAKHGRQLSGALRWGIWTEEHVEPWYRQNLLLAWPEMGPRPLSWDTPPADVVHPDVYAWKL